MLTFLLRRLVIAAAVAVTVSIIGFALLRLSGDLASVLAGQNASAEEVARVAHEYGLDRPLYLQYLDWLWRALHGDLGRSLFTQQRVDELILQHVGVTIMVALPALVLGLCVAIPLGTLAATRPNTAIDRAALTFAVLGQGVPTFWLALIMILVFGVTLRILPISGSDTPMNFVMPVTALAIAVVPALMRLTRTGMIDVLGSDYVRTARAKGLSPMSVLFKHALRNAVLPIVSLAAVQLGFLLGGSVVVESIFALNGLGLLAYQSIIRADFPVVQSILIFVACSYIVLTLVSDLVNARLDPRIRLE